MSSQPEKPDRLETPTASAMTRTPAHQVLPDPPVRMVWMVRTERLASPALPDFPVSLPQHPPQETSPAANAQMDPKVPQVPLDPQDLQEPPDSPERKANLVPTAKPDLLAQSDPQAPLVPMANQAPRDLLEPQVLAAAKVPLAPKDPTVPPANPAQLDPQDPKAPMASPAPTDPQDHQAPLAKMESPVPQDPKAHPDLLAPTLSTALAPSVLVALLWPKSKRI